jgi:hypothetical protein
MIKIKEALESTGKYWIAFVGDSITSTEWVHPNWREIVEYVLKEELQREMSDWKIPSWGIRCFNFGYDGSTTADILKKVDDIKLIKPDMVIGLMGGNDPTLGISVDDSVKNIKQIVEKLETQVVWCNSTTAGEGDKKNAQYEPYAKAFLDMEEIGKLQKIDMFSEYQKFETSRFFTFISEENLVEGIKAGEIDRQHPNTLGNAYIAKVILREVWGVEFDPEKYIDEVNRGEKLPKY